MANLGGSKEYLRCQGFSLVELLIYIAVLAILMTAVMLSFTGTLRRTIQQTGIEETTLESFVGLDLLRIDLEHAGFGLPWSYQNPINFIEPQQPHGFAVVLPGDMVDAPSGVPKAIIAQDNLPNTLHSSDYLIIRATNVALGGSSQKWGYLGRTAAPASGIDIQSRSLEPIDQAVDRVVVLRPEASPGVYRELVMAGGAYFVRANVADIGNFTPSPTSRDPEGIKFLLYGINNDQNINRPFNRVDYYVNNIRSQHCSPNTGTLVKAQLNQADNSFTYMPIVDCVADFQVLFYVDTDDDGGWDTRVNASGMNGWTTQQIRDRVKLVRYYVLTHEGGFDRDYARPNNIINVGEVAADGVTLAAADGIPANAGRAFDLAGQVGGNWANYRWKVESASVSMKNIK